MAGLSRRPFRVQAGVQACSTVPGARVAGRRLLGHRLVEFGIEGLALRVAADDAVALQERRGSSAPRPRSRRAAWRAARPRPARRWQRVEAAAQVLGRLDHVAGEFLDRVVARVRRPGARRGRAGSGSRPRRAASGRAAAPPRLRGRRCALRAWRGRAARQPQHRAAAPRRGRAAFRRGRSCAFVPARRRPRPDPWKPLRGRTAREVGAAVGRDNRCATRRRVQPAARDFAPVVRPPRM